MKKRDGATKISAEEFDLLFDEGEVDMTPYLDLSSTQPLNKRRRVNVDLPEWMIEALDREAQRLGISRQAVIKVWLAERLEGLGEDASTEE